MKTTHLVGIHLGNSLGNCELVKLAHTIICRAVIKGPDL